MARELGLGLLMLTCACGGPSGAPAAVLEQDAAAASGTFPEPEQSGPAPEDGSLALDATAVAGDCETRRARLEQAMSRALQRSARDTSITTSPDFTLVLETAGGQRFVHEQGSSSIGTRYESASTSKWVAATVILDVVERGLLGLDDEPSAWLPFWLQPGVTLAQLLSFTSGFGREAPCFNRPNADFADCNPRLAGGMTWSAAEYLQFLRKLQAGALLGPELHAALLDNQRGEATAAVEGSPVLAALGQDWAYGFGNWLECASALGPGSFDCGPGHRNSSPGAYGAYPFIDLERGYVGLLARQGALGTFREGVALFGVVAELADSWAAVCAGE